MNTKIRGGVVSLCLVLLLVVASGFVIATDDPGNEVWVNDDASDDAWVESFFPDENHGSSNHLRVGFDIENETLNNFTSFVRFDLDDFPEDAAVVSATLRLYLYNDIDDNLFHGAFRVLDGWDEDDLTWNTQPSVSETPTGLSPLFAEEGDAWKEWNVTNDVLAFLAGEDNYGWQIVSGAVTDQEITDFEARYRSDEYDDSELRPQLVVEYTVEEDVVDFQDLINLFDAWGPCPSEGECPYDYDESGAVDEIDLAILLAFWEDAGVTLGDPDVNGDSEVNFADILNVLAAWGSCDGDCPADVSLDGEVDGVDVALVQAFWGLAEEGLFQPIEQEGGNPIGMNDIIMLLQAWGGCPEEGECPYDYNGDGVVDRLDLEVLLNFWGLDPPQIGDFEVIVNEPVGELQSLSNIPVEAFVNASGDFTCDFSVWKAADYELVIDRAAVPNCTSTTFDLSDEDSYLFLLTVESETADITQYVFMSTAFTVNVPEPPSDGGGDDGGSSGGGGGGSGGGSCVTEYECEEWSACENGLQTRTCEKLGPSYCWAGEQPVLVQECEIEEVEDLSLSEEQTDANDGFVSALTGAVVDTDGNVRLPGVIMFIALLVAVYAFIAAWRVGGVPATEAAPSAAAADAAASSSAASASKGATKPESKSMNKKAKAPVAGSSAKKATGKKTAKKK